MDGQSVLAGKLGGCFGKLAVLKNPGVEDFVARFVEHCNPDRVFVCDHSGADREYIRRRALEAGEEVPLAVKGHTAHWGGVTDQGRDTRATRFLLPDGWDLGGLKSIPKREGLDEVLGYLRNSMVGREMLVLFFTLGPEDSVFSIPCVQITDSYYVAHNELILYRPGYDLFRGLRGKRRDGFFRFVHTVGEIENGVSKNTDKRRVYIDLEDKIVYTTNTQYGGNTIGLKKLAMRFAIQKACGEDWLCEHMFVMGVHGPKGRMTYFTGAYPSACGKTSTSMVPGETIVGDDIAYLRVIRGKVRAVNVEKGLFGIIADVNSRDDPSIYRALTTPREIIFSNVLVDAGRTPYWIGKDGACPERGRNYTGDWFLGKKDSEGKDVTPSHKNARYTIAIDELENKDAHADDPKGVEVGGYIYGGRDSDTNVPVMEAFDFAHGILTMGAAIESETTAATLGQEGVRTFNPMSNIDFLSVPIGRYVKANLDFVKAARKAPKVFATNYFIRGGDGKYLTSKDDKRVWLKWMELRVHGDVDAVKTPVGLMPRYEDLRGLFREVLGRDYTPEQYEEQFKFRALELMAKIDRVEVIYRERVPDAPKQLFSAFDKQRGGIEAARERFGDYISPGKFIK